jgi:hypothetical protein
MSFPTFQVNCSGRRTVDARRCWLDSFLVRYTRGARGRKAVILVDGADRHFGGVTAPTAVLIRADGYVAWVGDGTDLGLPDALTTWFGLPTSA